MPMGGPLFHPALHFSVSLKTTGTTLSVLNCGNTLPSIMILVEMLALIMSRRVQFNLLK